MHNMIQNVDSDSVTPVWLWPVLRSSGTWILRICPIVVVAVLWEFFPRAGLVRESVLPTFTSVTVALYELIQSGEIFPQLITSLYRALAGLAFGSILGIAIGILMARSLFIRDLVDPFVTLTFPLPKTAFIPIAILWLGVGDASIIFVVFLSTMVPMIISTYHAARSVHKQFVWAAQALGAPRLRVFTSIVIPASLTYILNGFRISLALSIVVVISSEMVAAGIGIGKFISLFGESGNYNYMFATILAIMCLAFLIDRLFMMFSHWLLRWVDRNEV